MGMDDGVFRVFQELYDYEKDGGHEAPCWMFDQNFSPVMRSYMST